MSRWTSLALALLLCAEASGQGRYQGIGRPATAAEVAAWDIDVRADFKGLPPGAGSVKQGEEIWEAKCTSCHGSFGESNAVFPPIAGGTTLMKLPRVSALWDYINRAMPWNASKTLGTDEVYALTAYILNLGRIVPDEFVLSERNIADIQKRLPNRDGMVSAPGLWYAKGKGDTRNEACMRDCPAGGRIVSRFPDSARGSHGDLAMQHRLVGPARGANMVAATPADQLRPLAEKTGCLACHGARQRLVGPSLAEIATRYRTDAGAESALVAKVKAGSQGVWGNVPMPAHPQLQESEVRALVRWILTSD